VIAALAGRRIDAPASAPPRFPLANVPLVRARLAERFAHDRPDTLVCSAACGADLLALDVAGAMGVRRRIVLPFHPGQFRDTSVVDRPGDWGPRFDRVIADVQRAGDLVLLGLPESEQSAYEATNRAILSEAEALASPAPARDRLALIVWDGGSRGAGDLTEQFLNEARARGWDTREVSSLAAAGPAEAGHDEDAD